MNDHSWILDLTYMEWLMAQGGCVAHSMPLKLRAYAPVRMQEMKMKQMTIKKF